MEWYGRRFYTEIQKLTGLENEGSVGDSLYWSYPSASE
jgi:hypothetical protein